MPRTIPSGIAAAYTQQGAYAGFIIRMALANSVRLFLTTFDQDFEYNGDTYVSCDVTVPQLNFDGTPTAGAALEFGDMNIVFWVSSMYGYFQNALIEIDAVYFNASNEAIPLFKGRTGKPSRKVTKDGETFSLPLDAEAATLYAPRIRVQDAIDKKWLLPAGAIIIINGQKWKIDRPKTSNT